MGQRAAIALGFQNKKYFISCFVLLCFTLNISDLGFTKFTIIVLISAGRVGDKNTKPIPTPLWGAGTKYCPILALAPLQGGENSHGAGWGGMGWVKAGLGKISIPNRLTYYDSLKLTLFKPLLQIPCYGALRNCYNRQSQYFILFYLFCFVNSLFWRF